MADDRGSIAFFATYRPLEPLDIFARPKNSTREEDESRMTDGISSNYNGKMIPTPALKKILKRLNLSTEANVKDADTGNLTGMIYVSEKDNSLETLHIALRFNDPPIVKVFSFADVYGTFDGVQMEDSGCVRMEDSGCIAGDYLVYISTMEDPNDRRQPWTAVYKTDLNNGETDRLTPSWHADLSPAASPNGKMIAVASFQRRGGWHGEIEDLQTDIYVMNLVKPYKRRLVVQNGGWPTWGSESVIFFHRRIINDNIASDKEEDKREWRVFRADISGAETKISPVTPLGIHAMTPAAISATEVVVATIRQKSKLSDEREEKAQYRHIEIFDTNKRQRRQQQQEEEEEDEEEEIDDEEEESVQITVNTRSYSDHYNPFVIDKGNRIGYHRCNCDLVQMKNNDEEDIPNEFDKLRSPEKGVGLFRISGVFPTFSPDGNMLAFIDNEFCILYVVKKGGHPRVIYQTNDTNAIFSPVWNKKEDTLYICKGPSFSADVHVSICAFFKVSEITTPKKKPDLILTITKSNNAFPSSSPDGKQLVFRTVREDKGEKIYKKLYIIEDATKGEYQLGKSRRLTYGPGTDTHCQWSPTNEWIVFSSTRDKPEDAPESDNDLDPGYFAIFLVHSVTKVVVRVMGSGSDISGHVNHPFFSPYGNSIAVTSDLAAVSVDPISLPFFLHSVRPYGDIFVFHIDENDLLKNKDVKKFIRITHSRYENSTPCWTKGSTENFDKWNINLKKPNPPLCPYSGCTGLEGWRVTGHLHLAKRCC
ncbi:uncharacterized protein LOC126668968 [Mercurialis annua]|uniref:uncharacterized protein LOC126668968 n=1 Tax=Mercurialis annua TaxID=3986 RepID=UPI00215EED5B|nr:uncharacterized protein LOC126668968 [Mercurialis annua]